MSQGAKDSNDKSADQMSSVDNRAYAVFQNLSVEEWREWIVAFLSGEPIPPLVAANKGEVWHQILIRILVGVTPKSGVRFSQALFEVFEKTPVRRGNERQLYTLLHVIAYATPGEAKQLLRRRLREGIFRGLEYAHQNLHNLLLLTCSKYHVDRALARYVQRSARASKDYDYLLLCQWVLSTVEGPQAFYFNERLIPLIDSPQEAAAAARQLTSISQRLGYSDFLTWYQSRSIQLEATWGARWQLFVEALRQRLLSDRGLPELALEDRDAVLLYVELRIEQDWLPLATILKVARLHQVLGIEEAISILSDTWKDLFQRIGEVPWDYISTQEKAGARSSDVGTVFQNRDGSYFDEHVDVANEPDTETVLMEVRSHCELLLPKKASAAG